MFQSAIFAHKLSEQFNDDIDKISSKKCPEWFLSICFAVRGLQ